ncbi:hypothetical protein [Paracoccus sp. SY]|uniref:hypothetical protein n=1 Tax=Paracoccus sp. SY TaxID=1330255 RepID=UPI000CD0643B|nr:hypothetical protein [Paracoccus sp. SY]
MAISNDEATRLIHHIELTVRDVATEQSKAGIVDIINQWRSDIEAGRQIERKLTVRQSPGLDMVAEAPRSRGTSSGEFVGKQDYTPIEQLDMLVAALGIAFIAPKMMAKRFIDAITDFNSIDTKGQHEPAVHLVGVGETDEPGPDRQARVSRGSIVQSHEQTVDLAKLLQEISKEADLSHRKFTDVAESS